MLPVPLRTPINEFPDKDSVAQHPSLSGRLCQLALINDELRWVANVPDQRQFRSAAQACCITRL